MEQLHQTIGGISRQILQNFTRNDNQKSLPSWELGEYIDWQHNLVKEACGANGLCPYAYETVFKVLIEIYPAENEEQAEEFLYDIEPYSSVEDLTAWFHSSDNHIEYLSRVLESEDSSDGLESLAKAHKLYLQETGLRLIAAINTHITQAEVTIL